MYTPSLQLLDLVLVTLKLAKGSRVSVGATAILWIHGCSFIFRAYRDVRNRRLVVAQVRCYGQDDNEPLATTRANNAV